MLHRDLALCLCHGHHGGHHGQKQEDQENALKQTPRHGGIGASPLLRRKHFPNHRQSPRQVGHDADCNHQRHTVADATLGDLLTQPHQQHGTARQRHHGLQMVPDTLCGKDSLIVAGQNRFRTQPAQRHDIALSQAKKQRHDTADLHDLHPTALFPREARETRDDRRHQLQNNRGTDVRHDSQPANGAALPRTTGEHAVNAEKTDTFLTLLIAKISKIFLQLNAIEPRNWHPGDQATDGQHQQREYDTIPQLRNFKTIPETGDHS